jgi:hypothetical protein
MALEDYQNPPRCGSGTIGGSPHRWTGQISLSAVSPVSRVSSDGRARPTKVWTLCPSRRLCHRAPSANQSPRALMGRARATGCHWSGGDGTPSVPVKWRAGRGLFGLCLPVAAGPDGKLRPLWHPKIHDTDWVSLSPAHTRRSSQLSSVHLHLTRDSPPRGVSEERKEKR